MVLELRKAASGSVAERQILFDTIDVCWSDERRLSQRAAAFRTFVLKQMASSSASAQDFSVSGYFEPFGH
jgi:hypothetical protein